MKNDQSPDGMPPAPDSPEGQKLQFEQQIKILHATRDVMQEFTRMQAESMAHAFKCLQEAGFSDPQALEIIKVRGSSL